MPAQELIETKTITTTGLSALVFSSIPQNYITLIARVNSRSTANSYYANLWIRPNGAANDSSSGTAATLYGNVAASSTPQYTRVTNGAWMGDLNGASCYANTFSNAEVTIPGYARTTPANKGYLSDSTNITDGLVNQYPEVNGGVLYCSAPITQLAFHLGSGSWEVGSYISLYGIRGA